MFANSAGLAGHVTVGDGVIIGGLAGVHQFVRIGDLAMLAAGAMVGRDVPPYCVAQGDHAALVGLNLVGLQRRGWSGDEIMRLRRIYKVIFRGQGRFQDRLAEARRLCGDEPKLLKLIDFSARSARGVLRAKKGAAGDE